MKNTVVMFSLWIEQNRYIFQRASICLNFILFSYLRFDFWVHELRFWHTTSHYESKHAWQSLRCNEQEIGYEQWKCSKSFLKNWTHFYKLFHLWLTYNFTEIKITSSHRILLKQKRESLPNISFIIYNSKSFLYTLFVYVFHI